MPLSVVLDAPRLKPCGSSILQQITVFCVQNYIQLVEPRFLSSENFHFIVISRLFAKKKNPPLNYITSQNSKAPYPSLTCYCVNTHHDLGKGLDILATLALLRLITLSLRRERNLWAKGHCEDVKYDKMKSERSPSTLLMK